MTAPGTDPQADPQTRTRPISPRIAVLAAYEARDDARRWLNVAVAQRAAAEAAETDDQRETASFRADAAIRAGRTAARRFDEYRALARSAARS